MKHSVLLSPLAFALAAMLVTTVQAEGFGGGYGNPNGANASVDDTQINHSNDVINNETKNTASIDGSLDGAAGNVGVNVAAGDNNQQANAAAIATADAAFVFGGLSSSSASASIGVDQQAYNNTLTNYGNPNNASVLGSANEATGNVAINVAAGNYNQQKNDMSIAASENALVATAASTITQTSSGNETENKLGDVFEVDAALPTVASGFGFGGGGYNPRTPQTPVVNNASLSDSLANASGNVGVNIAAGGGNQQSNSLAIAAGCNACVAQ
ncbi:hypothetical protein HNQ25_13060 [Pseudomonas sediminis]|uniref:Heme utilization protein n=2 Tax=Pseudomonas sediminis TaxID=1691904 RepID=A0ABX6SNP9_9PSED|nr:hypothetical protein HNQ25_13060 [Pseudomonas sediminis]